MRSPSLDASYPSAGQWLVTSREGCETPVACLLMLSAVAHAQTSIQFTTPHQAPLTPRVAVVSCFASVATRAGYQTVVTGFTADGNYVKGHDVGFYSFGSTGYRTYHT